MFIQCRQIAYVTRQEAAGGCRCQIFEQPHSWFTCDFYDENLIIAMPSDVQSMQGTNLASGKCMDICNKLQHPWQICTVELITQHGSVHHDRRHVCCSRMDSSFVLMLDSICKWGQQVISRFAGSAGAHLDVDDAELTMKKLSG